MYFMYMLSAAQPNLVTSTGAPSGERRAWALQHERRQGRKARCCMMETGRESEQVKAPEKDASDERLAGFDYFATS